MLLPHEERVLAEHKELHTRYVALCAFLGSPAFQGVPAEERMLLMEQGVAMNQLLDVLEQRTKLHAILSQDREDVLSDSNG